MAPEAIALLPNAKSIYQVPLTLEDEGIVDVIAAKLDLPIHKPELKDWREMVRRATTKYDKTVTIGIVAKYMDNADTYLCVFEALKAAAWWNDVNIDIQWVDAAGLEDQDTLDFSKYDGIVVPGGFGTRGVEGKIKAATLALGSDLPYLGLCYGLQIAVIAAARKAGLKDANTTEIDPKTKNPVITTMAGQEGKESTGGTMRLGNYDCHLEAGSKAAELYGTQDIVERHRHRYECNPDYVDQYEKWGLKAVGRNPESSLVEVIEVSGHPFFLASQFHPELKGRPVRAHPLFDGLIKAAKARAK